MTDVAGWLSPVNPKDMYEKVSKSRTAGSGAWFTESTQLEKWMHSKTSSTFWLNGISQISLYDLLHEHPLTIRDSWSRQNYPDVDDRSLLIHYTELIIW